MARGKKLSGSFKTILFLAAVAGLTWVGMGAFRAGPAPAMTLEAGMPAIGKKTPFAVTVQEPKRGLSGVRVIVVQGDKTATLLDRTYTPRKPTVLWGERTAAEGFTVEVGREGIEWLREGKATVRVVADRAPSWLRYPEPAVLEREYDVRLVPPQLSVQSTATYVRQGGCEAVVYRVGDSAVRDGVEAGDRFFPGYPLPGGDDGERFALFSVPWNLDDASGVRLVAVDDVDNVAEARFIDQFFPSPPGRDTIRVSDGFLEKVVPPILSQTPDLVDPGNLLDAYLMVNRDLRAANLQTLVELSADTRPEFLWSKRFVAMPNAQVMATFAENRTYTYNGTDVDYQTHLGFDLASVRQAPVPAANDGVVVLARYFGIYGNAVMIDHGYGLFSLYGHLSTLEVSKGQTVERGDTVGRTGATGLAGGDHLHFEMLLHGLSVNPKEWWDAHWIQDRLNRKLGDALPFD